jgi:hypothetical protein
LLEAAGRTVLGTVGGASGALYGRALSRAGQSLAEAATLGRPRTPCGPARAALQAAADSVAALASVADQLVHLLPRIRVALAAGATWTDTVNATTSQGGLELKRQVISKYTVAGDTTLGGKTAWKINRASTSATSGSGNIQGQNASMDGTSTGTGVVLLTHDGTFLGGAGQEDVKAKLTLTDAGVSYDIATSAKTTIDRVN